jgi:hypothetical protein
LIRGYSLDRADRVKRCLSESPGLATYSAVPKKEMKLSDDEILLDAPFIRKYAARQQQI